ncbi:MAG: DoxX family protein [Bacteroidetes bacterium]|nr:DoxX family protein [Bacteroidota bacterium]
MKLIEKMIAWLNNNTNVAYALIRIFIGVALFVRGVILASEPEALTRLAGEDKMYWWYSYITVAHIIGGLLLAIGLVTRLASLLQVPILFGAVFLIHLKQGLLSVGQSLELSVLVLVLLLTYLIFGAGDLSFDSIIKKKREKISADE